MERPLKFLVAVGVVLIIIVQFFKFDYHNNYTKIPVPHTIKADE